MLPLFWYFSVLVLAFCTILKSPNVTRLDHEVTCTTTRRHCFLSRSQFLSSSQPTQYIFQAYCKWKSVAQLNRHNVNNIFSINNVHKNFTFMMNAAYFKGQQKMVASGLSLLFVRPSKSTRKGYPSCRALYLVVELWSFKKPILNNLELDINL